MEDLGPNNKDGEIKDTPRISMINTRDYDEFEGYPSFVITEERSMLIAPTIYNFLA